MTLPNDEINPNEDSEYEDADPFVERRIIKDSIHDQIPLDPFICKIIDTPQFQRLRNLKQLGTSSYVWPCASHSRFEHCLGVGHLARSQARWLQKRQPNLGITDRDILCVQIAGLCHDLGHGPFSHVFDSQFIPRAKPGWKWQHEDASEMMFDFLLEDNKEDLEGWLEMKDVQFIKDLIRGEDRHPENGEKPFLFQIVANKINGLDVDKLDYITRDIQELGEKCNTTASRLITSCRVVGKSKSTIAYDEKCIKNIFELFQTRWSLHNRVYNHKAAKAIEYMLVDALLAAEPHLKIAERIHDPRRYLYLTDSIMEEIERSIDTEELKEARNIIQRIRKRKLYSCVDVWHVTPEFAKVCKEVITAEAVAREANRIRQVEGGGKEREVTEHDVITDFTYIHYGMKDQNPVDHVRFFSKQHPNRGQKANPAQYSQAKPMAYEECIIRVYSREPDQVFGLIQAGFRALQTKCNEIYEAEKLNANPSVTVTAHATPVLKAAVELNGSSGVGGLLTKSPSIHNPFTTVATGYCKGTASPMSKSPMAKYISLSVTGSPSGSQKSQPNLQSQSQSQSQGVSSGVGVLGLKRPRSEIIDELAAEVEPVKTNGGTNGSGQSKSPTRKRRK